MAEKDRVRTKQFRFTLLPEENAMLTKNAFEYGLGQFTRNYTQTVKRAADNKRRLSLIHI